MTFEQWWLSLPLDMRKMASDAPIHAAQMAWDAACRLHTKGKPSMTFEEFQSNVLQWATARGIYEKSTARDQLLKAFSEMGELADSTVKSEPDAAVDAVGDVLVCLCNYCHMSGINMNHAMQTAWDEIKDRKGHIAPGGAFVKE